MRTRQTGSDRRVSFRLDRSRFILGRPSRRRQRERTRACLRPLPSCSRRQPGFVGAHWFQYTDEPLTGRTLDGENAHIGFITVADLPYTEFVTTASEANLSVLRALEQAARHGER